MTTSTRDTRARIFWPAWVPPRGGRRGCWLSSGWSEHERKTVNAFVGGASVVRLNL